MPYTAKHIKGLPYKTINRLLSIELTGDQTHLSSMAIEHIRDRHPRDFALCIESLEDVIITPDYAGQSPRHPDNFVLVKEVNSALILVAINTKPDEYEDYVIQSAYVIDRDTLQRRIRKGYFKQVKEA